MIRRLRLENLVLIREAELELGTGLAVVTGETGAGKTIFAQALGLLLGMSGERGLIGASASEAYVEAELDLPEGILESDDLEALREIRPQGEEGVVLARRLFADGRSRAYAWGRAIPRAALGSLGQQLIAMSGQFEQRRLASATHQLELLDAFVGPEQVAHRDEARRLWRELGTTRRGVEQARERAGELESRRHELEALVDVVEGLDVGSEDRLRSERTTLLRVADLTAAVAEATELLSPEAGEAPGAADLTVRAADALGKVQDVDAGLDRTRCELQAAAVVLREATSAIRSYLTSLEADPARLEHVEHELQRIADARRRYGCADVAELIDEAEAAQALLDASGATSPLVAMEKELAELERRAAEASRELRACRVEKAAAFGDAVRSELERLGLGPGDLVVQLGERPPGPTGSDRVDFMLQANAGLDHAPVASTASGGELSRIALALRVVAHAQAGESTIVFDEIDAGIGGTTAHAVAESLGRLAERAQVIAITHLPQVASAANQHLRVEKVGGDPVHTTIEVLRGDERRRELERMLGGMEFVSSVAAEGARRDS